MNIKLNYLYRDAGNYKLYDSVVFRNDVNLPLKEIEKVIKEHLIDEAFFDPTQWGIKKLSFENYDAELDHDWHEFESLEFTERQAEDSIKLFLLRIEHTT